MAASDIFGELSKQVASKEFRNTSDELKGFSTWLEGDVSALSPV
jgi:hypothetical protein